MRWFDGYCDNAFLAKAFLAKHLSVFKGMQVEGDGDEAGQQHKRCQYDLQLERNVTLGEWNKAEKMGNPGESDRKYLVIKVADHKNNRTTGQPHDMVVAMAKQIRSEVVKQYVNKARPVILRQHGGQEEDNFRLPLFPTQPAWRRLHPTTADWPTTGP